MALGNANTTAQARGKNKAVKVRRRKEIDAASGFVQFSHGTRASGGAQACSVSSMDEKGWTDQTTQGFPIVAGDYFYTEQRAGSKYATAPGFYKVGPNAKGNFYHIEVGQGGQVTSTPSASTQCP